MDKPTLFLHIGYRKTGTTYLQKRVFPKISKLLYFCKGATPASKEFIEAFDFSPYIWRSNGDKILERLLKEITTSGETSSVLVSSESMSLHKLFVSDNKPKDRGDPYLLAAHLREIREKCNERGLELKVFLAVRRQDQYLASLFSGTGRKVGEISQRNFERQVNELLDTSKRYFTDGAWLHYKFCRDIFVDVLGENNLLILPQELLADDQVVFLNRLSTFFNDPGISAPLGHERENVRGLGPDVWLLRESLSRTLSRKSLATIGLRIPKAKLHLTKDLKNKILDAFKNSNARLAEDVKIDLRRYDYY